MQPTGHADPVDSMTFGQNYFLTGDVVVFGVGMKGTGVNGIATRSIAIPQNTIPANADPVAAFLYWETVTDQSALTAGAVGAKFRGNDISGFTKVLTPQGTSPCWSSGGGTGQSNGNKRTVLYTADVLRFFEKENGRIKVNNTSHEVKLADSGSNGNTTPFTLGASLVVLWRGPTDLNGLATPLRGFVFYHGGYTIDQGSDSVTQTMQGFYQAAAANGSPQAKLIIIGGDGQASFSERVLVNGTVVATNPFVSLLGDAWDNLTIPVTLPADAASATVKIDHVGTPYNCLTGGVFILSTAVQDVDQDGIVDKLETSGSSGTVQDPKGQLLPDLYTMGARPNQKDLFIEIGAMKADAEQCTEPAQLITCKIISDTITFLPRRF